MTIGKFSPAVLAMLKPQLQPALEILLRSAPPADVATVLLPHLEALVDPVLHAQLAAMLTELGGEIGRRDQVRRRGKR